MMKKNGFTLAEVLITLAIIGVVAVMTLPALMSNTQEQQARTAVKKLITSLTQAGEMSSAKYGSNFSGVSDIGDYGDFIANDDITVAGIIHNELSVNDSAPATYPTTTGTNHCEETPVFTLRDQTGICLGDATITGTDPYVTIWVDSNGPKGPNRESTCDDEGCANKSKKNINDQFAVTLYRGGAYPGHWTGVFIEGDDPIDKAARFAYDQKKEKNQAGDQADEGEGEGD